MELWSSLPWTTHPATMPPGSPNHRLLRRKDCNQELFNTRCWKRVFAGTLSLLYALHNALCSSADSPTDGHWIRENIDVGIPAAWQLRRHARDPKAEPSCVYRPSWRERPQRRCEQEHPITSRIALNRNRPPSSSGSLLHMLNWQLNKQRSLLHRYLRYTPGCSSVLMALNVGVTNGFGTRFSLISRSWCRRIK